MENLSHYLYNGPEFVMFDRIHVLSIVLSVLACIFLPVYITSLRKKLVEKIDFILISHAHGDHYFGLMGLISTYSLLRRTNKLTIFCPKVVSEIINSQMKISSIFLFCINSAISELEKTFFPSIYLFLRLGSSSIKANIFNLRLNFIAACNCIPEEPAPYINAFKCWDVLGRKKYLAKYLRPPERRIERIQLITRKSYGFTTISAATTIKNQRIVYILTATKITFKLEKFE